MYKPFEFYASERKLQSKIQLDLIRQEWSKLESRDQLRYIKQAESEYDKFFEVFFCNLFFQLVDA
jgi:hypothetical protein